MNHNGYVYIIKFGEFYKIGLSKNPKKRMRDFATVVMPYKFELIHTISTINASFLEKAMHNKFSHKLVAGEWYKLNRFDLYLIKKESRFYSTMSNIGSKTAFDVLSQKASIPGHTSELFKHRVVDPIVFYVFHYWKLRRYFRGIQ